MPPLRFHHIHGENIRISRNGTLAKRFEAFNKGITFSDRPVNPNERVYINIAETTTNWSGFIRFGFTVIDPETFYDPSTSCCTLPKHACPDLTNRHGFWAKALSERYCERANILTFYFTTSGDVHFGINGEDKGVFFKIPPTNDPLWLLFDVYGNCSAIEYINQRGQQNRIGSRLSLPAVASEDEVDGIAPQMQSMSVHEINRPLPDLPRSRSIASLRPSFAPLLFHRTRGQNIHLSEDKFIATRVDSELSQGYVFTARPVRIGERLIIQILRTEPNSVGGLTLGLTACDPSNLRPCDLPNDAEALLDRPEYWVVSKNIVSNLVRGDQIIFSITANGEVYISRNNGPATAIMQVDHDIQLWAFLDIFGSMQSIRVVSQMAQTTLRQASVSTAVLPTQRPVMRPYASQYLRQAEPIALRPSESVGNIGMNMTHMGQSTQSFSIPTTSASNGHFNRAISNNDMIQLKSGTATVLVVNIPPSGSSSDISVTSQMHQAQSTQMLVPAPVASPSRSKQTINQLQVTII